MEVIAQGRVTTYPNSSKYQIVIEALEPAGIGALMALLEERKRKFAAEGLFDEERKKRIPFLPKVVGIVTSGISGWIAVWPVEPAHRVSPGWPTPRRWSNCRMAWWLWPSRWPRCPLWNKPWPRVPRYW